jgi:glycosyltransferase involved in cell wall biosynthesis
MNPPVSVVVPVYNGALFVAEAIEAILSQDYQPIEVVVVDDGSTDETPAIVGAYPVRYVRQENAGASAARNRGLAEATGELLTFCDYDDVYHPTKVSSQVRHLIENPQTACVLVHHRTFVEPGTEPPAWMAKDDTGVQAPMIRRSVLDNVGGYNPEYRMSETMEWLGRMKAAGLVVDVLPDVLVDRRLHGTNVSYQRQGLQHGLLRSLRDRLQEKREAGQSP